MAARGPAVLRMAAAVLGAVVALVGASATSRIPPAGVVAADRATRYADRLLPGERLTAGQYLSAQTQGFQLLVAADGSVVVRSPNGATLWRTPAAGPGAELVLRLDGTLVLSSASGVPVWYNAIRGADAVVAIQAPGELVEYLGTRPVWSTPRPAWSAELRLPPPQVAPAVTASPGAGSTVASSPTPDPSPSSSAPSPSAAAQAAPASPAPARSAAPSASTSARATQKATAAALPAGARDPALYPFASGSPWNTAIGSGAQFEAAGGPRTASLMSSSSPVVNRESWSVSVALATTSDPFLFLQAVRNNQTYSIQVPAGAVTTAGADGHLSIVEPDRVTLYDTYKAQQVSATQWSAQVAFQIDLRGSGIGQGTRAANTPAIAGLIRNQELVDRSIRHALALAVPASMLKSGPVWPANREDSAGATTYGGSIPMGSLFAIPASVDVASLGLTPEGLALARALQDYGAYVVDQSGSISLYCELSCNDDGTAKIRAAWKVLYPHLRAVTNNSASSVGGGGTPRVAALPAIG